MALEQKVKIATILGHIIRIDAITNPTLKRLLESRRLKGFLFSHDDSHTDEVKTPQPHSEYKEVANHTDHTDRHSDNHYDYTGSGHSPASGSNYSEHTDRYMGEDCHTDQNHQDKGYSEHTDCKGR